VEKGRTQLLLKALGQRIRELRTERGFSQEGFADKCGVHRTFMGAIERGESNLSFGNIAKVASTLGLPLATLFEGVERRAHALASKPAVRQARDKPRMRRNAAKEAATRPA
jgi:transcriptional regulator with XRE-family HTH domain